MDAMPLLTMVKQRTIDEAHVLDEGSQALDQTLSMLCSFLSLEDMVSFLFSAPFASYARSKDPWVVFEVGLYVDHTKTLELVASADTLLFADPAMSGVWVDSVAECTNAEQANNSLTVWLARVTEAQ